MSPTHVQIHLADLAETVADQVLQFTDGVAADFAESVGLIVAYAVAPDDGSPVEHDARQLFLSKYSDRLRAKAKSVEPMTFVAATGL
jgi:hypothetical protein